MTPLRLFMDTEFTTLSVNKVLISIGFVSEHDEHSLYLVLDGWSEDQCSTFVVDTVLPLLDRHGPERLTRAAAAARIETWMDGLRGGDRTIPIIVTTDTAVDWTLLQQLFVVRPAHNIAHALIADDVPYQFLGQFFRDVEAYFRLRSTAEQPDGEQHHALVDARALKHAWHQRAGGYR